MQIKITKDTIQNLVYYNKYLTYFMNLSTEQYVFIQEQDALISIIFKFGTRGLARFNIKDAFISESNLKEYLLINYNKFFTALTRLQFNDYLKCDITPKKFNITSDITKNKDNISIHVGDITESTITRLSNFFTAIDLNDCITIENNNLQDFFHCSSQLMTALQKNSSLKLGTNNIGIYADRSIIYKASIPLEVEEDVIIHNETIKFMQLFSGLTDCFNINQSNNTVIWSHTKDKIFMETRFIQDEANGVLPSLEEIESYIPESLNECSVSIIELKEALNFFAGFFEVSVWNPLTFTLSEDNTMQIVYKTASNYLEKYIPLYESSYNKNFEPFTLSSTSLKFFLSAHNPSENPEKDLIKIAIGTEDEANGVILSFNNEEESHWALFANIGE